MKTVTNAERGTITEPSLRSMGPSPLREALDKEGKEWRVLLIAAGTSRNGVEYPLEVLHRAVPLFEGVRAFSDHATKREIQERPERSVKDIVGWFDRVTPSPEGLLASFHVAENASWLRDLLMDAHLNGKRDMVGFSIDAAGEGERIVPDNVFRVREIVKVNSVDVVTEPAAGGRIMDLIASAREGGNETTDGPEEDRSQDDDATAPGLAGISDQELIQLLNDQEFVSRIKAIVKRDPSIRELLLKALRAEVGGEEEREGLEQRQRLAECRLILTEALSTPHNLPYPIIHKIESYFKDRVFDPSDLFNTIRKEKEVYAKLIESGSVKGYGASGARVGLSEQEKMEKALDGFFANEDVDGVPRFRSFREAYVGITGDQRITGSLRAARRLTEAMTTSSWTEILGSSITKRMLAEYRASNLNKWRAIVSDIVPLQDFRTQRRVRFGGYGTLPTVAENDPYSALTSPTDEEATYSISKRGGTETLTLEMVKNDDVGAIRRIPARLARGAAQTLYRFVFDMIKDNSTIYDALALFHASHNNLLSTSLSDTSLFNAYTKMIEQTAYNDSSDTLELEPKYLLVPPELVKTAYQLVNSPKEVGTADNQINFHSTYNLEVIMIGYWTDTNNWYMVADPSSVPTIEIGFLDGQEEPELFVQDMPTSGSMFNNDQITYKIRHIYGGAVLDYRGFQGSVVA